MGIAFGDTFMRLERLWDEANRTRVLAVSGAAIAAIALLDWWTKPYVSLGFLYLFPIMLASAFLPRWVVALVGAACAYLAELFSSLGESPVRLGFETLALAGCGLFVGELVRNRRISLLSQVKLKALVETSPAAIVVVDERGSIELANRAARELLIPRKGDLIGDPVAAFLPDLHFAIRWEEAPQFRSSLQCRGHRGDGEAFLANVWFSTYQEGRTRNLAAIIADISEEVTPAAASVPDAAAAEDPCAAGLSTREVSVLRLVVQGLSNREIGQQMDLSEGAVKNTMRQLFAKTGVRTRAQLVRAALEQHRKLL
jgi:two-component system sensor kinase FixL